MQRITIRLPDNVLAALEAQARNEHRNLSNMASFLLSQGLGIKPDPEESKSPKTPELPLP